ncbi:imidazolonepropionase [Wandonia haliotis]|uniref:Imidazolonepropionase n=1 Tax=Wandonia haliotis TaxID=574963 RepID=A0ABN1MSJ1_9FLAO
MSRLLIKNIKGLVQAGENLPRTVKGEEMKKLPVIENAFLAVENGKILSYGPMEDMLGIDDWRNLEIIDASGKYILPAFCDSHTHVVFAKSREEEFVDKINGLSYEEIAAKGGGILNSARVLGETDEEELYRSAWNRLDQVMYSGTGAIEIKSGYGLTPEAELKMLRVIKRLRENHPLTIKSTFLGAHAYPKELKENHPEYLRQIKEEMLPVIHEEGLADYIDAFCERGYFSVEELVEVMNAGKAYGLIPKIHVNQFSILGGVKAAVEHGALSVDHLEEISEEDIAVLKGSTCMPTVLPSCSFFLNIPFGKARMMLDNGLPLALATDFNPGTTPSGNMLFLWSLACIKLRLTPEEALNAMTINTAYAMGLSETHGTISEGKVANLIMTKEIPSLAYIPYSFGENTIDTVLINGKIM